MNRHVELSPTLTLLLGGACFVIIIAGVKEAASTLNIILLAILLTQSIGPLPNWLMAKKFSPGIAVLVTLLIVTVGGLAIISLLGTSIAGLIEKMPSYQERIANLIVSLKAFLAERGIDIAKIAPRESINPARIAQVAGAVIGTFGQMIGNGLLLLFLVIVFLLEATTINYKVSRGLYPEGSVLYQFDEASRDSRKYVGLTGLAGLIQAVANVIVLEIAGIDFAVTWGVLFFFLNFVPGVGLLMALIPPAAIALLDYGWERALVVILSWMAINFVGDNIVKPRFMTKGFDIPLSVIILALLFWTWVLGPVGTVLAVPLTLTLKKAGQIYLARESQTP
jgi:predicted PurR-regulated permease PerM